MASTCAGSGRWAHCSDTKSTARSCAADSTARRSQALACRIILLVRVKRV